MGFHIALTGGIASGKTAVSDFFSKLGISVIDADIVSRQVIAPKTDGLTAIVEHFGQSILQEDGYLDRNALRKIIFSDESQRTWLNKLMHPMIRSKMNELRIKATSVYSVSAIPLLIESQQTETYDRVLVIDCPVNLQIQRLIKRDNCSYSHAQSILATQASRHQRLSVADDIIINNADLLSLEQQVITLDNKYRQLAQGN